LLLSSTLSKRERERRENGTERKIEWDRERKREGEEERMGQREEGERGIHTIGERQKQKKEI